MMKVASVFALHEYLQCGRLSPNTYEWGERPQDGDKDVPDILFPNGRLVKARHVESCNHHLAIRPTYAPELICVKVSGLPFVFRLHGWKRAGEIFALPEKAKKDMWWGERDGKVFNSYMVNDFDLHPMSDLLTSLELRK